jgi:hypothetical protein
MAGIARTAASVVPTIIQRRQYRETKNLFCKKRSHDRLITFSHLPESTAGIGTTFK